MPSDPDFQLLGQLRQEFKAIVGNKGRPWQRRNGKERKKREGKGKEKKFR